MLDALDSVAVRRWSALALASIETHQSEIDDLNVFPIPDSDTGTNLALTLRSAADALQADATEDAAKALRVLATGAVLGARGNSGVIVSQMLRSFADAAEGHPACDAQMLRVALQLAADGARTAVAEPVEGTILTVASAAAAAVDDLAGTFAELARTATEAADSALQRTPRQLAVLASAGVVDAGGRGLVLVLDALARVAGAAPVLTDPAPSRPAVPTAERETGSSAYGYEVQYLLDADDEAAADLRAMLTTLGDSVVVAGTGAGTWNVHVHVNDVGSAIEAGIAAGRPYQVSVVRFADQHAAHSPGRRPALEADPSDDIHSSVALIAIAPGQGLGGLFESEGVTVVGEEFADLADVLAAIHEVDASAVVLLPNVSSVSGIAESAAEIARGEGTRVAVVPTRAPMQALAAIAVHVPGRRFDDDVVAMAEAAAATRFAEILIAEEESLTSMGVCQAGDVLGLIDGDVVEIGHGLLAVAFSLADRLLGVGAELMTVLVGADAQHGIGDLLRNHVRERSSLTEVQVYDVGQPDRPLIIGVE